MGRKCTVCGHAQREQIDADCLEPTLSLREIAERYGLSYSSMARHRESHLPKLMSKAVEARVARGEHELFDQHPPIPPAIKEHEDHEQQVADGLLDKVLGLEKQAMEILAEARQTKSLKTALMAIGRTSEVLKLEGELVKRIKEGEVNVLNNIVILPAREAEDAWASQRKP